MCYQLGDMSRTTSAMTWWDARDYCMTLHEGGGLVEPRNSQEQNFISNRMEKLRKGFIWTGISKVGKGR